jgi:hypothetical protein
MNVSGVKERKGGTFHVENAPLTATHSGLAWRSQGNLCQLSLSFSYHHHATPKTQGPLMAVTRRGMDVFFNGVSITDGLMLPSITVLAGSSPSSH